MQKNDEIILEITGYTSEGSGIGRAEGMAVFVPMTAKGDIVKVKILKIKKTYAYGKAEKILSPAKCRIQNTCPSFLQCGGCVYRHISYAAECEIKADKVFGAVKHIGGINLPPMPIIASDNPDNYRNKAQYPIAEDGSTGFYAFHSHRIIKCDFCKLQPEIFSEITRICSDWTVENKISIYNSELHNGLLRHLYIRFAEKTDEIMICLVINGSELPKHEDLTNRLKSVLGGRLKSLQININREKTNVIMGDKCLVVYGEPYITDILCGIKVRLSPLSFYQVNRSTAEKLYKKAAEYAQPDGKKVLDLYCGAGTVGLSMARRAKKVIGVEIIPDAVKDARFNAKLNGIENAEFICADAFKAAKQLNDEKITPDVIIVDPPRKGCTKELIDTVAYGFKPERVVYISCDPATFARDLKLFEQEGYILKEYTPVDMFPRTAHVETVAILSRKSDDK